MTLPFSVLCFQLLSCQINYGRKSCEGKATGRNRKIFPITIIIDREKIRTVVAISETDGENTWLGKLFPGINDILMTTSHDRAGITTSIQAVITLHQKKDEADREVKNNKLLQ